MRYYASLIAFMVVLALSTIFDGFKSTENAIYAIGTALLSAVVVHAVYPNKEDGEEEEETQDY